jgi:hypothetical protein
MGKLHRSVGTDVVIIGLYNKIVKQEDHDQYDPWVRTLNEWASAERAAV